MEKIYPEIPLISVVDKHGDLKQLTSHEAVTVIHGLLPDMEATYAKIMEIEAQEPEEQDEALLIGLQIGLSALLYGTRNKTTRKLIEEYIETPIAQRIDWLPRLISALPIFRS